ncbi:carbon monoxide dehydrogenase [Streptomyces sp. NPDC026665]|uniref:carbon monoxide dehydrogenase n=1 Tax=Streptomyces sp. NPDC026665 TaxID=3154798 RepID=UPI00340FB1DA
MEHEVFVPFPAGRLREALADPVRVARAIPGLQQDASAVTDGATEPGGGAPGASGTGRDTAGGPSGAGRGEDTGDGVPGAGYGRDARIAGRLKVRVAGHTITYRGSFRVSAQDDDSYAVEGDATEVRGAGAVKLALTLRLLPGDGGTTLAFGGTASGDGRVAELPHDAVASTGTRLLTRFAEALTADLASRPGSGSGSDSSFDSGSGSDPSAGPGPEAATEPTPAPEASPVPQASPAPEADRPVPEADRPVPEGGPAPEAGPAPDAGLEGEAGPGAEPEGGPDGESDVGPAPDIEPEDEAVPGFEADVTSSPLGPAGDDEFDGEDFVAEAAGPGRADAMAEAAHARRTMIGRSAEEVDHAPPRGRYAPVPPPEATAARATLRWAAPAAALALASAIALTRALRKRR